MPGMSLGALATIIGFLLALLSIVLALAMARLNDHPRFKHWCGIGAYISGAGFVCVLAASAMTFVSGMSPIRATVIVAAFFLLLSAIFWPRIERIVGIPSASLQAATSPSAVEAPKFEGSILWATNLVRPQWDHRVVLMAATVRNIGVVPSKLSMWSFTGSDYNSGQVFPGLFLAPTEAGVEIHATSHSGIVGQGRYDRKGCLVYEGDQLIQPGARVSGLLMVKFPVQVNNATIKVGFQDDLSRSYTVGLSGAQVMP